MKEYTDKTERGTVKSKVSTEMEDGCPTISISHDVVESQEVTDPDVKEVMDEVADMDLSGFQFSEQAEAYRDGMQESYIFYGRDGVKTQLNYVLANVDEGSEQAKILKRCIAKV